MTDPHRFSHLTDTSLRAILAAPDDRLRKCDVAEALEKTFSALGRDICRDDIPARAIEQRRAAAKAADAALRRSRKDKAMAAIRKFWM